MKPIKICPIVFGRSCAVLIAEVLRLSRPDPYDLPPTAADVPQAGIDENFQMVVEREELRAAVQGHFACTSTASGQHPPSRTTDGYCCSMATKTHSRQVSQAATSFRVTRSKNTRTTCSLLQLLTRKGILMRAISRFPQHLHPKSQASFRRLLPGSPVHTWQSLL